MKYSILSCRKFLEKLPDKGKKISDFYRHAKEELRKREEHENLCSLISNLNFKDSQDPVSVLEWTHKNVVRNNADCEDEYDTNPLQILATHSSTSSSKQETVKLVSFYNY